MAEPREVNILVLGSRDSPMCKELDALPSSASVVAIGLADELLENGDDKLASVTTLLNTGFGVSTNQREDVARLWPKLPNLRWMHTASAGVSHILCDELVNSDVTLTNAKGTFSSSLAEYAMTACLHFAKEVPTLQAQQRESRWKSLTVRELRGSTMGVVGFGDIGQATARLARAFGMGIVALRRRVELSANEQQQGLQVFPPDRICEMMRLCDYIVAALPSTPATEKLVSAEAIAAMKPGAVFCNLGRGTTVDEAALIEALQQRRIRGAALDVFATEPLPEASPLWQLGNALVSPHCADRTETFLHEAVRQFVGLAREYGEGRPLRNVCDKQAGY